MKRTTIWTLLVVVSVLFSGCGLRNAQKAKQQRSSIQSDLQNLATRAYAYKLKPESMGGGSGSYEGLEMKDMVQNVPFLGDYENGNGTYKIASVKHSEVILEATGKYGKKPWIIQVSVDDEGNNTFTIVQSPL